MKRIAMTVVAGSVLLFAGAAEALPPLSPNHTAYGVSQLWAGHSNLEENVVMRLRNPNRADHVALFFVYDRVLENVFGTDEGEREIFRSCGLRVLTPHASIGVSPADFAFIGVGGGGGRRFYAEVLAAPIATVSAGGRQTRVADALGITVGGGGDDENRNWTAVNPALFNLPDDRVAEGQRQDAVDCACLQLEFGIQCQ